MSISSQEASQRPIFSHWAVTKAGRLMPVNVIEQSNGWTTVRAPGGQEYHYPEDRVLDRETGAMMQRETRTQEVLDSYRFERISVRPMVYRCTNPAHPIRSNYILTQRRSGSWSCSCPAAETDGDCKHSRALRLKVAQDAEKAGVAIEEATTPIPVPLAHIPIEARPAAIGAMDW